MSAREDRQDKRERVRVDRRELARARAAQRRRDAREAEIEAEAWAADSEHRVSATTEARRVCAEAGRFLLSLEG